jgi:hypothetical protein
MARHSEWESSVQESLEVQSSKSARVIQERAITAIKVVRGRRDRDEMTSLIIARKKKSIARVLLPAHERQDCINMAALKRITKGRIKREADN